MNPRQRELEDFLYHSDLLHDWSRLPGDFETRSQTDAETAVTRVHFETVKYPAPLPIGISSNLDEWSSIAPMQWDAGRSRWTFELIGHPAAGQLKFKIRLGEIWMDGGDVEVAANIDDVVLTDNNVYLKHRVVFATDHWHPNHLITLRNVLDGWGRDLFGYFFSPADKTPTWTFELDRSIYREPNLELKLMLGRQHFMKGHENVLANLNAIETRLVDAQVEFDAAPPAYVHAYDNLVAEEPIWEQRLVRPATRGSQDKLYDVLVVGSGMAGGSLADALADSKVDTLVLEAGGLGYPVHMNGLPRGEEYPVVRDQLSSFHNLPNSHFVGGLVFCLGGRSNYWSGLIPEMQEWEFGAWPDVVKDDLLFGPSSKPSYYELANKLVKKQTQLGPYQDDVLDLLQQELAGDFSVEILPRSMHQPNLSPGGKLRNVLRRSNGAYSTADLLLDSLGHTAPRDAGDVSHSVGNSYLDLCLHHLTTRIEPHDDHVVVHCQDLVANDEKIYRARHAVLCCGCVESPRLAIQSGLVDPNNKMGHGLTDHAAYSYPHYQANIKHTLPSSGPLGWLHNPLGHAKVMLRPVDHADGPFNIELLINGRYWDIRHADEDLWNLASSSSEVTIGLKFQFESPLNENNKLEPQGEGKKPWVYVERNEHGEAFKEQMWKARNRILTALGVPASELSTDWVDKEWDIGADGSVQHAGGSMRMSDDGTGVVDANLKLLAYDNIYCCDPSVFASIPAANPSLTAIALSLRLAKHLRDRLSTE